MNNLINKIGIDKITHFSMGGLICALFTFIFLLQDFNTLEVWQVLLLPLIGTVVTFVLSIIKEFIIDEVVDWKDIIAGMLGCVPVYIAIGIGILFNLA
jgi:hypothetical protein